MHATAKLSLLLASLVTAGAIVTGCVDEKVHVDLQPDRSGKLLFDQTLGKEASEMILGMAEGLGELGEALEGEGGEGQAPEAPGGTQPRGEGEGEGEGEGAPAMGDLDMKNHMAAQFLGNWEGIAAWTDVKVEVTQDKRFHVRATGWFDDLGKVQRKTDEGQGSRFEVEAKDGGLVVRYVEQADGAGGLGGGGGEEGQESLFDKDPAMLPMMKEMTKGMLTGMLEGLRQEVRVTCPGEVSAVEGFKKVEGAPRAVEFVRTAKDLEAMIGSMFDIVEELSPKVKAGELTKEEAEAQMKQRMTQATQLQATCQPAGETPDAFKQELAAAKQAWAGSEWKQRIEEARQAESFELPEEGEEEPEMPEDEDEKKF